MATHISGFLKVLIHGNLYFWLFKLNSKTSHRFSFVSKKVTCSTPAHIRWSNVFRFHSVHKWSYVEIFHHNILHITLLSLRKNKIENEILLCELVFNLILFCINALLFYWHLGGGVGGRKESLMIFSIDNVIDCISLHLLIL